MPDIALDFCMKRREEVIQHLVEKYGKEKICRVATFGTFSSHFIMQDTGIAMGMSRTGLSRIFKVIPKTKQRETLKDLVARRPNLKLRRLVAIKPRVEDLLAISCRLEGQVRLGSTHAAGIAIAPRDIQDYMPIAGDPESGMSNSQYSKKSLEMLGLIELDFLGLDALSVIDCAVKLIHGGKNSELDLQSLPLDDKATYDLISSGDTDLTFYLSSPEIKKIMSKLQPTCFEEIVAVYALYRPGPLAIGMLDDLIERKFNRQSIAYIVPELAPILENSFGILVYQEQFMLIIQAVACFTLGRADLIWRALGKNDSEVTSRERKSFLDAATAKGVLSQKAEEIFELLNKSLGYCFLKAHAAAHALIAYQSAWLKANYPDEFRKAVDICN